MELQTFEYLKTPIALILQILSQTDYYPATYSQSSVTHPLIIFAIVFW